MNCYLLQSVPRPRLCNSGDHGNSWTALEPLVGTQKGARKRLSVSGKWHMECKGAFLPRERKDFTSYLICLFSSPSVSVPYIPSAQCPTLALAKPTNLHGMFSGAWVVRHGSRCSGLGPPCAGAEGQIPSDRGTQVFANKFICVCLSSLWWGPFLSSVRLNLVGLQISGLRGTEWLFWVRIVPFFSALSYPFVSLSPSSFFFFCPYLPWRGIMETLTPCCCSRLELDQGLDSPRGRLLTSGSQEVLIERPAWH